ncbi:sodium:proton antiporter [Haloferula rosea]|uniref:NADH-quinone oxidoreductase subunit K n=1 Tax=Haloferula rosea TaxID=490093 RepID=A0A934RBE7_9BACT|nr:NADH-quinone oxidoreductase subunit K [Haloferula rosea]MBK1826512.1 NADH-quinone oxidoreductase subunit K [Haloferula rosea]
MTTALAILIGLLFAAATYCLLRRNLMRVLIGILLLSHAVNLLLMSASAPLTRNPAILGPDGQPTPGMADPLPQALVLTAIVIGFGLSVFTLVLARSCFRGKAIDDVRDLGKEDGS